MPNALFRGKRIDNGEWIEGFLVKKADPLLGGMSSFILVQEFDRSCIDGHKTILKSEMTWYKVYPETVGQFTGLTEINNGRKIFEKDIIQFRSKFCHFSGPFYVKWSETALEYYAAQSDDYCHHSMSSYWQYKIIGNLFDNPELMEATNENNY